MAVPERSHRYEVSGNPEAEFVDDEGLILVNLRGISDLAALQLAEEEGLARAYEILLDQVRTDTRLTCELIRHVHRQIFGDLFEWRDGGGQRRSASRWRSGRLLNTLTRRWAPLSATS